MVSNSLNMDLQELLKLLQRIKREHGKSPEFEDWRKQVPKNWPI
ncbi:MAG: hypothetical protein ACE1ZE_07065 [Candidatus Binatia bacterium]